LVPDQFAGFRHAFMRQIISLFFKAENTRPWAVLACLVMAGFAEALGISSLLPLVNALLDESAAPAGANAIIRGFIERLGITPDFGSLIVFAVALMLLKAALSFAALSYSGITSARVAINLRRQLIAAIFDAKWSYYADQSGGKFANAISNDATRAGDAYQYSAVAVAGLVQLAAYVAIGLFINWRVALIAYAAGLVLALIQNRLIKISKRAGYKQTDRVSSLTTDIVDMLNNIKALKSMHRYQPLVDGLSGLLKRLKRSLVTIQIAGQGVAQGSDAITAIMIGVGAFVAHKVIGASLAELLVSGIVFFQIMANVKRLQKQMQTAAVIESAYVRTQEFIDSARANREAHGGTKQPELGPGCAFKNVSFAHGKSPTIVNASLDMPAGQITVLQGPSGSGKTTIIDLLIGLHQRQSGDIVIGNDPIDVIDIKAWRAKIGYVPQDLVLFHDTVRANIILGDETITDEMVKDALRQAHAEKFVARLPQGLDTDVGELGARLSGGQRQRIALARALVNNPDLLILDEVTSALDPETEADIIANIGALGGKYTIIAITHRPAWMEIADRLYTVAGGHVRLMPKAKRPKAIRA
jgi:ATP-binding cassette, subfamily C, bacterial